MSVQFVGFCFVILGFVVAVIGELANLRRSAISASILICTGLLMCIFG